MLALVDTKTLSDIGDAIRLRGRTSELLLVAEMPDAILAMRRIAAPVLASSGFDLDLVFESETPPARMIDGYVATSRFKPESIGYGTTAMEA